MEEIYSKECLREKMIVKFEEIISSVEKEWDYLGLCNNERNDKFNNIYNSLNEICDKIIEGEKLSRVKICNIVDESRNEVHNLVKEMNIPYKDPDGMALMELKSFYEVKLSELKLEKEKKLVYLKELIKEDEDISKYLSESPFTISQERIPSSTDLDLLKGHINEMIREKKNRIHEYNELRNDIIGFTEKLEKSLDGCLLEVFCNFEDDAEICVSKSYIQDLRKLHTNLETQTKDLESQALELRKKISSLWEQLKMSDEDRNTFLETVPKDSPSCIKKLENEVDRLMELRKQNLPTIIADLKKELNVWWGKCYIGEEAINKFNEKNAGEAEEVLKACENELDMWREYYSLNSPIFERIDHFLSLFDKMQVLEEKMKDPSRLFNTRGGALLQEEKERKKVKANLPIVQNQLMEMGVAYEAKYGYQFLIDGKTIEDYLNFIWSFHEFQKEKERNRINNKSKNHASVVKKPHAVTPGASRLKRMREVDDVAGHSKAKRPAQGLCQTYGKIFKSPAKLAAKTPISAQQVKKPLEERNCPDLHHFKPCSSDDTTQGSIYYDEFKEHLKKSSENVNSTTMSQIEN